MEEVQAGPMVVTMDMLVEMVVEGFKDDQKGIKSLVGERERI